MNNLLRDLIRKLNAYKNQLPDGANLTPLEVLERFKQDDQTKLNFIHTLLIEFDIRATVQQLDEALYAYSISLQVANENEGIFAEPLAGDGIALQTTQDTCFGTYFAGLAQRLNQADADRVLYDCNVIYQRFLPQPGAVVNKLGLVVGQVQSGKTTVFNGIISAAADNQFNVLIILSGTLESLRQQTQNRIINDVTNPWNNGHGRPFTFTWISNHGGPGLAVPHITAAHHLPNLGANQNRQVAIGVFLKNGKVLFNLKNWLAGINPLHHARIRAIIIDDECDQVTPNGGVDGRTIAVINNRIKDLIIAGRPTSSIIADKTTYLGFTATPFANLLNEHGDHTLYPKDFLYFLKSSNRYFGPVKVFGKPEDAEEQLPTLDVIRLLTDDDIEGTVPNGPAYNPTLTPGLKTAIRWFLLCCANKRVNTPDAWCTMLVHTSHQIAHHRILARVVQDYITDDLLNDWNNNSNEWRQLWQEESQRVTMENFNQVFPNYGNPQGQPWADWNELIERMQAVIADIKVKIDNSEAEDAERLSYGDDTPNNNRLQIAIGGNTLSRGLTLEGLVSSYFARRVTTYDTLLQMGRWFGYRQGYELLPRIWTTPELVQRFREIVFHEQHLRAQFEIYLRGASPGQRAVQIPLLPALAITRKKVIGNVMEANVNFCGTVPETTVFNNDANFLGANITATQNLINDVQQDGAPLVPAGNRIIFRNINRDRIIGFLNQYNVNATSNSFIKPVILDFINQNHALFATWSLVFMGGRSANAFQIGYYTINKNNRNRQAVAAPNVIDLSRLSNATDLLADQPDLLNPNIRREVEVWNIRRENNLGPALLIYPIDQHSTVPVGNPNLAPLAGFAVNDVIAIALVMPPPPVGQNQPITVQLF